MSATGAYSCCQMLICVVFAVVESFSGRTNLTVTISVMFSCDVCTVFQSNSATFGQKQQDHEHNKTPNGTLYAPKLNPTRATTPTPSNDVLRKPMTRRRRVRKIVPYVSPTTMKYSTNRVGANHATDVTKQTIADTFPIRTF